MKSLAAWVSCWELPRAVPRSRGRGDGPQRRRNRFLRRAGRERERAAGDGGADPAGDRTRTCHGDQGERQHRLDAPGVRPCEHPAACEAIIAQIWVNAPPPKGAGFGYGSKPDRSAMRRTQVTLKLSSGSGGTWFLMYSIQTWSVTLPLLPTQ
jgi:hypothetical protein